MKKAHLLFAILLVGLTKESYAQFTAGLTAGAGRLTQRQESLKPGYNLIGVEAGQPLLMGGVYGQYATKGKRGFVGGLQLRYQRQRQTTGYTTSLNPTGMGIGGQRFNRYSYIVATPYVGVRPFGRLELAVGPEVSFLSQSQLATSQRTPTQRIAGYNVKATYWFGPLGVEGGYSYQKTAFDQEEVPNVTTFRYYNQYVYGMLKFNLVR